MRISDWSSDVCSSDLEYRWGLLGLALHAGASVAQVAELPASTPDASTPPVDQTADHSGPLPTIPLSAPKPAPLPVAKNADGSALEEIIVTAQRRTAPVQETTNSMEAFNADKSQQRGVQGVREIGGEGGRDRVGKG